MEFVKAAAGLDPNTIYLPKLIRYLVMCYQAQNLLEQTQSTVRQGLQFFPDYADLYYYSGLSYLQAKHYALAMEAFQQAISLPEQPPQYVSYSGVRGFLSYYNLGLIAEEFLNDETALENYAYALRDNADFLPALERLVHLLEPRKDPGYAKEFLEKSVNLKLPVLTH